MSMSSGVMRSSDSVYWHPLWAMWNKQNAHYHAAIADCNQAMVLYLEDEDALKAALAVYTDVSDVMRDYPSAIRLRDRYAFAYHLRGLGKQALGQHTGQKAIFGKRRSSN